MKYNLLIMITILLLAVAITGCYKEAEIYDPAGMGQEFHRGAKMEQNVSEGNTINVVIETNKGNIFLELDKDNAPVTVENFLSYVEEGHYSGTVFHRVIDGFMIQGGGFTADARQKKTHNPIALESNNGLKNKKGTIAMARTMVPDSATSQFFINVADNGMLDYTQANPGYAVFGKVVSGMDVVNAIKVVETGVRKGMGDWPVEDVVIEKVYVKE